MRCTVPGDSGRPGEAARAEEVAVEVIDVRGGQHPDGQVPEVRQQVPAQPRTRLGDRAWRPLRRGRGEPPLEQVADRGVQLGGASRSKRCDRWASSTSLSSTAAGASSAAANRSNASSASRMRGRSAVADTPTMLGAGPNATPGVFVFGSARPGSLAHDAMPKDPAADAGASAEGQPHETLQVALREAVERTRNHPSRARLRRIIEEERELLDRLAK